MHTILITIITMRFIIYPIRQLSNIHQFIAIIHLTNVSITLHDRIG